MKKIILFIIISVYLNAAPYVEQIGQELPPLNIYSSAVIDGKLYLGGDAGFLFEYDEELMLSPKATTENKLNNFALIQYISPDGYAIGAGNTVLQHTGFQWKYLDFSYNNSLNSIYKLSDGKILITAANGYIYYSENDGNSWMNIKLNTNSDINSAVETDNGIYLLGDNGLFIFSDDFFTTYNVETHVTSGNILSALYISTNQSILILTQNGKIISYNIAGSNFTEIYSNDEYTFSDYAVNGSEIVLTGANSKLLISDDNGQSWNEINYPFETYFNSVTYMDDKLYLSGNDSYIAEYSNNNFTLLYPQEMIDFQCISMYDEMYYAGSYGGKIYTSQDGVVWTEFFDADDTPVTGIDNDGQYLYAVTASGRLFVMEENSFTEINFFHSIDGFQSLSYSGGKLFASTIKGDIYKIISKTLDPYYTSEDDLRMADIYVDNDTGFAVGDMGKTLKTTDNGASWNDFPTDFEFPLLNVFKSENEWIISGMYGQIATSVDGMTFDYDNSHYPDGESITNLVTSSDGSKFLATTLSGNIIYSENKGISWDTLASTYSVLTDIISTGVDEYLVAGHSGNLLKVQLDPTSVINPDTDKYIKVFPQPASEILNIILKNNDIRLSKIEITDISGKLIYAKTETNNDLSINISDFKSGVYFIKFQTDKETYIKKIIIE